MRLEKEARIFVFDWIDFILNNADITDEYEYDIVDEYDEQTETMELPVVYVIKKEEEKVYIVSINTKGLEQQKRHKQF